jgi:hypothetical protein
MLHWLKDHVVPHVGNDYRPHLLQKVAMVAMLGLVFISFALANVQALFWLNSDWLISAVLPAVVVEETNEERADAAVGPLTRNVTLDRAAQLKAEHMAEQGYFAHYAPDGTSPWHWFRAVNYPFVHAGENLAVHFNDSHEVVEAWMDSPTHRANIMNGNYTEIGIGVAKGRFEGFDTVFVVQMFGTPAAVVAEAEPEPESEAVPPVTLVTVFEEETTVEPVIESPRVAAAEETTATPAPAAAEELVSTEPEIIEEPAEPVIPAQLPVSESVSSYVGREATTTPTSTDLAVLQPTSTLAADTETPPALAEQFMATTTNLPPADLATPQAGSSATVSWLGRAATSPHTWLEWLYTTLALLVTGVLAASLLIEWRRQHPLQMVYTAGLLGVMGGLYYLQTLVTTGATIALAG